MQEEIEMAGGMGCHATIDRVAEATSRLVSLSRHVRFGPRLFYRRVLRGYCEGETGADTRDVFGSYATPMLLNNLATDRQTESGSSCTCLSIARLHELLEDQLQLVVGNGIPFICNRHRYVFTLERRCNLDKVPGFGELAGVAEEVPDGLVDRGPVGQPGG